MTSRTHDMVAFASLLTVATYYPPDSLNINPSISCLIGCTIGALIPDMDQATNRLWDLLPAGNLFGKIFRNLMLRHRTISHSVLGIWILYKVLEFIVPRILNPNYVNLEIVIASILIGFISHIAADMLTKEGVPLLFPLPFKIGFPPFESLRIKTGKFMENFVVFPSVIIYLVWLVSTRRNELLALIKLINN